MEDDVSVKFYVKLFMGLNITTEVDHWNHLVMEMT